MSLPPDDQDFFPEPLGPDLEAAGEDAAFVADDEILPDLGAEGVGAGADGASPQGGEAEAPGLSDLPALSVDAAEGAEPPPDAAAAGQPDDRGTRTVAARPERVRKPKKVRTGRSLFTALGAALSATDVYTWLLGVSVAAIMLGVMFFFVELSRYNFKVKPAVESSASVSQ